MSTIRYLTGAAYGIHLADQIALVSVPLIAALVFGASPEVIGILVACQSAAHLLGSIPFGLLVDQGQLRRLAITAALMSLAGFLIASVSVTLSAIGLFGFAVTLAGFGTVLFGLTSLSILPRVVGVDGLAKANAAIEIPRALCSFMVPLSIGLFVSTVAGWTIVAVAALGASFAVVLAARLPSFERGTKPTAPVLTKIWKGGQYVARHNLLLPICLCSVFWNFAFAALLVVLVPVIHDIYWFDPGTFGIALSAFGFAAVIGSWITGQFGNRIAPSIKLLFGPSSSAAAAAALLMIEPPRSEVWLFAAFFLLGFGPSMWLVVQNSIRQLVTPPAMLGRVNAVIQTAIYGVRPLGALAGGFAAGTFGPMSGLAMVVAAYALSFAVSLLGGLKRVSSFDQLRVAEAS